MSRLDRPRAERHVERRKVQLHDLVACERARVGHAHLAREVVATAVCAQRGVGRGRRRGEAELEVRIGEAEAERAQEGRIALAAMMNGGAFEARPDPIDPDPAARVLVRDGVSIGQLMILKGHARPWSPKPIHWCAGQPR